MSKPRSKCSNSYKYRIFLLTMTMTTLLPTSIYKYLFLCRKKWGNVKHKRGKNIKSQGFSKDKEKIFSIYLNSVIIIIISCTFFNNISSFMSQHNNNITLNMHFDDIKCPNQQISQGIIVHLSFIIFPSLFSLYMLYMCKNENVTLWWWLWMMMMGVVVRCLIF